MPLFLITGLPGSGKSTVNGELKTRGYESYDGDEDHLARWYSDETQQPVEVRIEDCTPDFLNNHSRNISRETIAKLAANSRNNPVFVCGDPENEEELNDLFAKVFALVIDDETLKHRIATRANNDWGKLPHELAYSLAFKQKWDIIRGKFTYITVDATQPIKDIVDQILEKTGCKFKP